MMDDSQAAQRSRDAPEGFNEPSEVPKEPSKVLKEGRRVPKQPSEVAEEGRRVPAEGRRVPEEPSLDLKDVLEGLEDAANEIRDALEDLKDVRDPSAQRPSRAQRVVRGLVWAATVVASLFVFAFVFVVASQPVCGCEPRSEMAKNDLKAISGIIEIYRRDHDGCPSIDELKQQKLFKQSGNDPWSHPYLVLAVGTECAVYSLGPDGKPGTDDDLCEPAGSCGAIK